MEGSVCPVVDVGRVHITAEMNTHSTRIEKGEYFSSSGMKPDAAQ